MAKKLVKRLFCDMDIWMKFKNEVSYQRFVCNIINRYQSQWSKAEKGEVDGSKEANDTSQVPVMPKVDNVGYDPPIRKCSSTDDDLSDHKWHLELDWLTKALEPALQLCRRALTTGNGLGNKSPTSTRSLTEILAILQRSKLGFQDWSLSDLTIGLFLIYLQQASQKPFEEVKGVQIFSDSIVLDLIYHIELAKGAYRDNAAGLARNSMLRESNVLKFIKDSSIMRPGYYIGIDHRKKLVILGIRGTRTVSDLITDVFSSSNEVMLEGYSTHFGTSEAARWFLSNEMGTIKNCLDKHEGFRLRLVGHSLGGAIASLLAIMLRKKSSKELGFSPDIVTAIGYAPPPSVSRELAECCSDYVSTVVMQDDIIPRLSVASLTRLRNEILQTDWRSVLEKEDWKNVVGLVTNAKQVVSSVQDVARKLVDYAKFRSHTTTASDPCITKDPPLVSEASSTSHATVDGAFLVKNGQVEELFVPGSLYYLKRNSDNNSSSSSCTDSSRGRSEYFTLWRRDPGEHFQRIILSNNLISDHKCDTHYYALRDVIKGNNT